MTLLLLLNEQLVAAGDTTDAAVTVLLEGAADQFEDISADFMGGDTRRGKQRELDRHQAGTCSVRLRNSQRQYDPNENANIKPGKRLAIRGTYAGVTYPLFTGYVDRVAQDYLGPNTAEAVIEATDAFKRLNKAALASSAYAQEVINDGPIAWYRLGEPAGSTKFYDAIGTNHLTVEGTPTLGIDGPVSRETNTCVEFPDGDTAAGAVGKPVLASGKPMSLEFIFRCDALGALLYGTVLAQTDGTVFGRGFEVGFLSGGLPNTLINFQITSADTSDNVRTLNGGYDYEDGLVHHCVFTWDTNQAAHIYIDGVEVANEGAGPDDSTISGDGNFSTSLHFYLGGHGETLPYEGLLDEVAIYDHVLSAARVAAHAEAVVTPWNNDTPAERADRVLDAGHWPDGLRDLDTGESVLQSATLGGISVLEHLYKVAESEFGLVYVTADGRVRLESRTGLTNQPVSGVLTDDHSSEKGVRQITPEYTDDLIRNDITISRSEGVAQNHKDEASIDEFGPYSYSRDGLLHDSDDLSLSAAQFLASEYSQPLQRVSEVVVLPQSRPAYLWPLVLGLELSDKVTVEIHPQEVGAVFAQDSVVEGIRHTIGPKTWETSYSLSPAYAGVFWQIGVPGRSEIGETTRVYF